jgi:hypothetical protein
VGSILPAALAVVGNDVGRLLMPVPLSSVLRLLLVVD